MHEAPKAAWSPIPLTELCLLLALVLLLWGFLGDEDRRPVLLGCSFALLLLAGGELALREHLAGFRSHTALLAGICGILVAVPFALLALAKVLVVAIAVAAFAAAFMPLRRAFVRRSGGLGFRA